VIPKNQDYYDPREANEKRYSIPRGDLKKAIAYLEHKEAREKVKASMYKVSDVGLNNRLPASLKLVRFIKNKNIEVSNNLKRFEAIAIIEELGFSVDMNDLIILDE